MIAKNYILGYGSLIEKESRLRTTPNAQVIFPVKAKGFRRGWFARTGVEGLSTTFLGCIKDDDQWINGIIYEVNEDELKVTDSRELGYERVKVEFEKIVDYSSQVDLISNIWIYLNKFDKNMIPKCNLPNKDFPIVQSYVDMCINGCLEVEQLFPKAKNIGFASDFIKTTFYWNSFWVNDRIYPRRPFIYKPNAYVIDRILKENLPDKNIFTNIYFE